MIQLGGFGFIKDYDEINRAGFDYAELDMPEIEALNEQDFDTFRAHVAEAAFDIPNGARILPITEPTFFVPGFRVSSLEAYVRSSCAKCAQVGIKNILFGNGKARWLVDEDSLKKEQVFVDFLRMLCNVAGEHGQRILIEPLGPKYSNYMNTVPEAARVIDLAAQENLFVMADLRHFVWSGEPFDDVVKYRDLVKHVHVDFPLSWPERRWPKVGDGYNYGAFFEQLKDYDGTLTIEADVPDDWQAAGRDARVLLDTYTRGN